MRRSLVRSASALTHRRSRLSPIGVDQKAHAPKQFQRGRRPGNLASARAVYADHSKADGTVTLEDGRIIRGHPLQPPPLALAAASSTAPDTVLSVEAVRGS